MCRRLSAYCLLIFWRDTAPLLWLTANKGKYENLFNSLVTSDALWKARIICIIPWRVELEWNYITCLLTWGCFAICPIRWEIINALLTCCICALYQMAHITHCITYLYRFRLPAPTLRKGSSRAGLWIWLDCWSCTFPGSTVHRNYHGCSLGWCSDLELSKNISHSMGV